MSGVCLNYPRPMQLLHSFALAILTFYVCLPFHRAADDCTTPVLASIELSAFSRSIYQYMKSGHLRPYWLAVRTCRSGLVYALSTSNCTFLYACQICLKALILPLSYASRLISIVEQCRVL